MVSYISVTIHALVTVGEAYWYSIVNVSSQVLGGPVPSPGAQDDKIFGLG